MTVLFSLASGVLFGLGLILSGMVDPSRVLGFLDLAGSWDPSLAFVMAGAIAIGAIAFGVARKRSASFLGLQMRLPAADRPDKRLIAGSLLFGVGWGIGGFCPGPALVSLGAGHGKAAVFVLAMLAGMGLFEMLQRRASRHAAQAA